MKSILTFFIISLILSSASFAGSIKQIGFFKDKLGNRIYTLSITKDVTVDELMQYNFTLPHTDGQLTSAYYYKEGAAIPADRLTTAASVSLAKKIIYEAPEFSKWDRVFMADPSGNVYMTDCEKNKNSDLCKQ